MNAPYYVALTNCPNQEVATKLATACVENKLAACVNIVPTVQSVYQWQGKIEHDEESLLIIKTTQSKITQLGDFIQQNHPYDVPEFITLNIESGAENYLDWLAQSIRS